MLKITAVEKDEGFQAAFESCQHHPVGGAHAHTEVPDSLFVDVGTRLEIVNRASEILRPRDELLTDEGRPRKRWIARTPLVHVLPSGSAARDLSAAPGR